MITNSLRQRLGQVFTRIGRRGASTSRAGSAGLATHGWCTGRRSLAAALAAVALLSQAPAGWAQAALPWKTGSFVGPTNDELSAGKNPSPKTLLARIKAFDNWRGRKSGAALQFISFHYFNADYAAFLQAPALTANLAAFKAAGLTNVFSIPLVNKADAGRFAHVAAGGIDAPHQAIANRLRQIMGTGRIYLRLGWESDHGYPWSISGHDGVGQPDPALPADYIAAWRRIASIYKSTLPGAVMVWNTLKNPPVNWARYYPGDDVVGLISIDLYDNGAGGFFSSNNAAWKSFGLGSYDAATGRVQGMKGVLDFARSRGKKIALDEWGVTNRTLRASDGANNSFFAPAVFKFLNDNKKYIEYEFYFNLGGGNTHLIYPRVSYNLRPSKAYLTKW